MAYGGNIAPPGTGNTAKTEDWDGTSWTEVADLATARATIAGAGPVASGFAARGTEPAESNATEEWTAAYFEIKTMTTS